MYLLYLLFQENKSFGASTICIHPLMYGAVSGTIYFLWHTGQQAAYRQQEADNGADNGGQRSGQKSRDTDSRNGH
jgi:hypothetical protein